MWFVTANVPWLCFARWIRFPRETGHGGGKPYWPKPEPPGFNLPFPPALPSAPSRILNPQAWPAKFQRFRPCVAEKIGKGWTVSGTPAPWSRSYFARSTALALRLPFDRPTLFLPGTGCRSRPKPPSPDDRLGTGTGKAGRTFVVFFSGCTYPRMNGRRFKNKIAPGGYVRRMLPTYTPFGGWPRFSPNFAWSPSTTNSVSLLQKKGSACSNLILVGLFSFLSLP